ncbi:MAG: nucleoid-associated protein [Chryseobacterium sp.]|nr:MAG: nucleoid-associated protein [Chryseobacterium sp.]
MISFFEASMKQLSVHHTGNKLLEEYYKLSDAPLVIEDELMNNLLMQFFLKPFEKSNEVFRFFHPNNNLSLNDVYSFVTDMFNEPDGHHEGSELLAKHLYDVANHPKIKSGELYVAYFEKVQIEGEQLDAIGIFKSETKETYLDVYPKNDGFGMSYKQDAISLNKLDKGCLIFNTEKDEGYKVVVFDQEKTAQAVYWKDEFLKLIVLNDNYTKTANLMGVFKNFVTEKLDDEYEMSKSDKIDLLNRSVKYFKEKESFDQNEFANEVIGNADAIETFSDYKSNYEEEYEVKIGENFEISDPAVKSKVRSFKNEIKLDKNFKVSITGSKDLIVRGYDEEKSMNFYKLYFREEE